MENPAHHCVFCTRLMTSFPSCNRRPQRGNMHRQCTLKHFIIDSCSRFLDKRQRPKNFETDEVRQRGLSRHQPNDYRAMV